MQRARRPRRVGCVGCTYPGGALSLTIWATSPSPDLDGATPAQTLARRGGLARVLETARALTPATW